MRPPPPGDAGGGGDRRVGLGSFNARIFTASPLPPQAPSTFLLDEPRPMRPDELAEVRALWWRLAAQGIRMPAERGVIVLDADNPRLNPTQTERQK